MVIHLIDRSLNDEWEDPDWSPFSYPTDANLEKSFAFEMERSQLIQKALDLFIDEEEGMWIGNHNGWKRVAQPKGETSDVSFSLIEDL
jgi:hypothetical protein